MHDKLRPSTIEAMIASEEGRKELNLSIYKKLGALVGDVAEVNLRFDSEMDSEIHVEINKGMVHYEDFDFVHVPDYFTQPVFTFKIFSTSKCIMTSTPYSDKPLPSKVINAEEMAAYEFTNLFYFDAEGNAAMSCDIGEFKENPMRGRYINLEQIYEDLFYDDPKDIKTIDFIPKEEDSGLLEMIARDYLKVLLHLQLIEDKQFVLA